MRILIGMYWEYIYIYIWQCLFYFGKQNNTKPQNPRETIFFIMGRQVAIATPKRPAPGRPDSVRNGARALTKSFRQVCDDMRLLVGPSSPTGRPWLADVWLGWLASGRESFTARFPKSFDFNPNLLRLVRTFCSMCFWHPFFSRIFVMMFFYRVGDCSVG